jgi:4-amino-4-deoxy-L-arabinose transferase-like glycosyltransferase
VTISRSTFPWLLAALCLCTRLLFFAVAGPWRSADDFLHLNSDSPHYHRLACNLLDRGTFASDGLGGAPTTQPKVENPGQPDDLRTPAYPLFVAGVYAIFGRVPWVVSLAQILLDTLTCWLLFRALERMVGFKPAAVGAVLYALDPFVILNTYVLLSEILFLFLIVCALAVFVFRLRATNRGPRLTSFALFGALLGVATLARPIAQYLPVVLIPYFWIVFRRHWKAALLRTAVLAGAFVVVLSPWLARNHRLFGEASLTYIGSWDLLAIDVAAVEAPRRGTTLETTAMALLVEADSLMVQDGRNPAALNNLQRARYWMALAQRYIKKDPAGFAFQHAAGVAFTFFNLATSDFATALHQPTETLDRHTTSVRGLFSRFLATRTPLQLGIAASVGIFLLISYLGLLTGLVVAWRRCDRTYLWFCVVTAVYFLALVGAAGVVRLRLPAMPFLLSFIGVGLMHLWERARRKRVATISVEQG